VAPGSRGFDGVFVPNGMRWLCTRCWTPDGLSEWSATVRGRFGLSTPVVTQFVTQESKLRSYCSTAWWRQAE
jgi:hypothetical protein